VIDSEWCLPGSTPRSLINSGSAYRGSNPWGAANKNAGFLQYRQKASALSHHHLTNSTMKKGSPESEPFAALLVVLM
jgi:hypothetical protein